MPPGDDQARLGLPHVVVACGPLLSQHLLELCAFASEVDDGGLEPTAALSAQSEVVYPCVFAGQGALEEPCVFGSSDELGGRALSDQQCLCETSDGGFGVRGSRDGEKQLIPLRRQAVSAYDLVAARGERSQSLSELGCAGEIALRRMRGCGAGVWLFARSLH
jgi:hypothetical protein